MQYLLEMEDRIVKLEKRMSVLEGKSDNLQKDVCLTEIETLRKETLVVEKRHEILLEAMRKIKFYVGESCKPSSIISQSEENIMREIENAYRKAGINHPDPLSKKWKRG